VASWGLDEEEQGHQLRVSPSLGSVVMQKGNHRVSPFLGILLWVASGRLWDQDSPTQISLHLVAVESPHPSLRGGSGRAGWWSLTPTALTAAVWSSKADGGPRQWLTLPSGVTQ
jgi:hypothetical protein